jgi:hypothetical protein
MPGEPGIEGPPGLPGQQGPAGDKGENGELAWKWKVEKHLRKLFHWTSYSLKFPKAQWTSSDASNVLKISSKLPKVKSHYRWSLQPSQKLL